MADDVQRRRGLFEDQSPSKRQLTDSLFGWPRIEVSEQQSAAIIVRRTLLSTPPFAEAKSNHLLSRGDY